MATRSFLSALASAVKLNPRLSAGLAFEIGVMVGAYIRASRGKRGIAGATAKLIDAVPLIPHGPVRRTAAKRTPPRRRSTRRKAA